MKLNPTRRRDSKEFAVKIDGITDKSLSTAVVRKVSSHLGKEVDEMPPIRDRIDPEALDSLFKSISTDSTVEETEVKFGYDGCLVTISSTGTMRIDSPTNGP